MNGVASSMNRGVSSMKEGVSSLNGGIFYERGWASSIYEWRIIFFE